MPKSKITHSKPGQKKTDQQSSRLKKTSATAHSAGEMKWEGIMKSRLSNVRRIFFQLLRNYPDGSISIIDSNHKFIFTGGELHSILEVDPRDLIGMEMFPRFPENLRIIIKNKLKHVFQGGSVAALEIPVPLKGNIYMMDAFPLKEDDGSIIYAGIIIRNISKMKLAEEELRQTLQKERELNELKSRFVTMASHEFRTPLTTILTSARLLTKYRIDDQAGVNKHINRITSSVGMLNEILNDFLSVAKIEEGKIEVKPVSFDIESHVRNIITEVAPICKRDQRLIYSHSGGIYLTSDPYLIRNILINLLSNAIKFSSEGTTIRIETSCEDHQFVLSVKDDGIGIPDEYREHLFERFYRAQNAINIQGTGLGLHIVNKYVDLINGSMDYTSEIGKGTQFNIRFNYN